MVSLSTIYITVLAFLCSFTCSWIALSLFPKWKLLDSPQKYGHHRDPIPYPGGIIIAGIVLIGIGLSSEWNAQLAGFLGGATLLTLVSFYDDRFGVHPAIRLFSQIGIGTMLVLTGTRIVFLGNPFGDTAFELPFFLSTLVTICWITGMINTVNWLDGVPGAAAGTSTLAGIFLGILSLTPVVDQPELATMCFLFAAANAGFLFFNIAPPKMLNGDSGAMFSGFMIAVFSIFSGGKMATAFLVLALPMFDAASVIFHRLRQKRSPLQGGDKQHLHDKLREHGFSDRQILAIFLFISLLLGISALFLQTLGKLLFLVLLGTFIFVLSWQHQKK